MPDIERFTRRQIIKGAIDLGKGIATAALGVGLARNTRVARAEGHRESTEDVQRMMADASAESDNPAEAVPLFEPDYKITWPDGKSFTVINPPTGNKGLVFQDQEVWMIKRDPITLVAIRDSEGKPVFEDKPSTTKVELKKLMDRYGVSKILIVPNKEKATIPTPFGQKNTPEDNEPFMFSDWYTKPQEYPDYDLVMFYWFAETERELEQNRLNVVGILVNTDIGFILPIFRNRTPGEVIKDYAYNTQEQQALAGDLGLRIKPVRYALEIT